MRSFLALLGRDLRLVLREGGATGTVLGFYLVVVAIMPLGIGPDRAVLTRVGPGVLWVALLLSVLLSVDRIFHADHDDGTLEGITMGPLPVELVVAAKCLAHWLTTGIPLALLAPVLALMLNLESAAFGPLVLTLLVGTPGISFIGAIGAALTLGLRRGGLLVALLVLPLYVPMLVFGVSAVDAAVHGPVPFATPFSILAAISLAAVALSPFAAAAALRAQLQ